MSAVTPDLVIGYDDRMAEILIRGIDEAVIEALRREADARGTSIEAEARRILTTAAGLDRVCGGCHGPRRHRQGRRAPAGYCGDGHQYA